MDLAVQVDVVGKASEGEHPEGEVADCEDAVLYDLHRAIGGVRTPGQRERKNVFPPW